MRTPLIAWIVLFAFIIGFSKLYERNNPDDFLFPFQVNKFPEEFQIDFQHLIVQPDHITCGPTSATMVLLNYKKSITLDQVKKITKTVWFKYQNQDIGMTTPDYITLAMGHFGVPVKMSQGNLNLIKYAVSHNKPCIVLVRSGENTWHYFVIIGYDIKNITIADPGYGNIYSMPIDTFLKCWNWTTNTSGQHCQQSYLIDLLKMVEVYPNTVIIPRNGI